MLKYLALLIPLCANADTLVITYDPEGNGAHTASIQVESEQACLNGAANVLPKVGSNAVGSHVNFECWNDKGDRYLRRWCSVSTDLFNAVKSVDCGEEHVR